MKRLIQPFAFTQTNWLIENCGKTIDITPSPGDDNADRRIDQNLWYLSIDWWQKWKYWQHLWHLSIDWWEYWSSTKKGDKIYQLLIGFSGKIVIFNQKGWQHWLDLVAKVRILIFYPLLHPSPPSAGHVWPVSRFSTKITPRIFLVGCLIIVYETW